MKYIVEKYFKKFNVAQTSYLECLLGRVCQWVFLMQKYKKEPRQNNCSGSLLGGPDRIRTDDPHNANVVRSQLRYRPECSEIDDCRFTAQLLYSISAQKATT